MIVKVFEVRDRATFIPVIAIQTTPANKKERYLLARAGYGTRAEQQANYVLMSPLRGGEALEYDPYHWADNRTRRIAHEYIKEHFEQLESGAVVDVQYIVGETERPALSEARQ